MKKTGLWIDHKKAVIVTITDQGEEVKQILSHVERQLHRSADSRPGGPFESQSVPADDRRDHKFTGLLNGFYDEVVSSIHQSESILIFGPGEAKGELQKWVEHKGLGGRIVGVETVDKMTEHQVAAKVRKHFSEDISPAPKRNTQRKEDDMSKNSNKHNSSPVSVPQQPKAIQVVAPQQPKVTPDSAPQQPKTTQAVVPQSIRDIPRSKQTPAAAATHDDIAKRAYEIYAKKGGRQGDSEQNWKQAEQELKK
jgi:hypothetical protein